MGSGINTIVNKIGLIFPGQGSQYIGMSRDLYDQYPKAQSILNKANEILGFDLKKIMFEGPEETLKQTQYTQPAIFAMSVAVYEIFLSQFGDHEFMYAGHSLGEYSALCASGAISFEDGLKMVKARGEFIQSTSEKNPGTMAAIIGLEKQKVEEICMQSKANGVCEAVNFNSPGQIVIAGSKDAIQKAVESAQSAGAMKAVVLNVSGPFHSSLMTFAAEQMNEELKKYSFNSPKYPVVTNCDAEITTDRNKIAEKLVKQINNAVLWEDSIKKIISSDVSIFIELGPQRVLSGLMRRIDKTKKTFNIEDKKTLEKTLEGIKQ